MILLLLFKKATPAIDSNKAATLDVVVAVVVANAVAAATAADVFSAAVLSGKINLETNHPLQDILTDCFAAFHRNC